MKRIPELTKNKVEDDVHDKDHRRASADILRPTSSRKSTSIC